MSYCYVVEKKYGNPEVQRIVAVFLDEIRAIRMAKANALVEGRTHTVTEVSIEPRIATYSKEIWRSTDRNEEWQQK